MVPKKTIKVEDETHRRLLRIMGTLQAREGKRKTVEDAIEFLLEEYERDKISVVDKKEKSP